MGRMFNLFMQAWRTLRGPAGLLRLGPRCRQLSQLRSGVVGAPAELRTNRLRPLAKAVPTSRPGGPSEPH